jgi:nicotinamide-nucleotide amidase
VGDEKKIRTHQFHFRFDRQRNIELTATNALNMLRKLILEN